MPMPRATAPIKHCKACGERLKLRTVNGRTEDTARLRQRTFCNRACMTEHMEGRTKVANDRNGRRQAAKAVKPRCEMCGRSPSRLHVHHRDDDPQNNHPSNLQTLCPSCHRRCHSPNFTETGEQRKPCRLCSRPSRKAGLCHTHLSRRKRYGDPCLRRIRRGSQWVLIRDAGRSSSPSP